MGTPHQGLYLSLPPFVSEVLPLHQKFISANTDPTVDAFCLAGSHTQQLQLGIERSLGESKVSVLKGLACIHPAGKSKEIFYRGYKVSEMSSFCPT